MDVNHTSEMEYSGTTQNCLRAFILFACLKPAVLRLTLIYRTHKQANTHKGLIDGYDLHPA